MNELALFAGAGGGILGGHLLGWNCRVAVELDAYAASVLLARQNEGILPPFPIWDDVCTFDGKPWRGYIDVVSGGFPCTDISIAGGGAGIDGAESGLWREMARIIGEVRPSFVLIENSPAITFRGGVRVIADLAALGYDCRWGIISAADAIWDNGHPCIDHLRDRIWIAASRSDANCGRRWANIADGHNADGQAAGRDKGHGFTGAGCESFSGSKGADVSGSKGADAESIRCGKRFLPCGASKALPEYGNGSSASGDTMREGRQGQWDQSSRIESQQPDPSVCVCGWWTVEPDLDRMATGVPARMDRIRCIGMSQVPAVVKLAWETLKP